MTAHTVTTLAELEALPVGTIIRGSNPIYANQMTYRCTSVPLGGKQVWDQMGMSVGCRSIDVTLPAEILWHPEVRDAD